MHIFYLCASTAQLAGAPQTFWDVNKVMLTAIITWVVGLGGTWLARYQIPPSNWLLQAIRVFLGAVIDQIHPVQFKQMAVQAKATKLEAKAKVRSALNVSLLLMTLVAAVACGAGALQKQLTVAMLAEQQAVKYEALLATMVEDAIASLPVEQRPAATAKYNDIKAKLDTALATLETTLQDAAVAASTSGLNIGQLVGDVSSLIGDLVNLVKVFAPDRAVEANKVGLAMVTSYTKVKLVQQANQ